jgi:D-alanyl-lipoteichoic acid acyltransferase DltB (MBOAT superfamily)
MLRMISFNMEYDTMSQKLEGVVETHIHKCSEGCDNTGGVCLKYVTDVDTESNDYTVSYYLIYIFYPPLYFAGPTINYNSFIYQLKLEKKNVINKAKVIYALRYLFVLICFELFNSNIYVNLFLTSYYTSTLFQHLDYYQLAIFSFFLLLFIWFKFTVIWRTTRLWAWLDDIYTEENMNRCVFNNYSFEGFWRAWHKSFNIWLIRYMYKPLGGSKLKIYNTWVIFSFVALWHDLKVNLLLWGWFNCLALFPEIVVKSYFNNPKRLYLDNYFLFRLLKYLSCSFFIVLLVLSNLIGFGMGHEGLLDIILEILNKTSFIYVVKILLFLVPSSILQLYIRELESLSDKKNNF